MKLKYFCGFVGILAILSGIASSFYEVEWLRESSQIILIFSLFGYFFDDLQDTDINFYGFFIASLIASIADVFEELWYFSHVAIGFWMVCFWFLVREALQYTEYSKGSRLVRLYFILAVGAYAYLLSRHLMEIEKNFSDDLQLLMYLLYYFNLLALAVTALIYYLNSFSRKSVYFLSFVLALIFSNLLRDMVIFYSRDLSVEIAGLITKFASFVLIFLFFATKEKRLRLLNLV